MKEWALEHFGIDFMKDVSDFLKEAKECVDFQDFIEVQKRLQNEYLRSLLYSLVSMSGTDYCFDFISNKKNTIFELKDAFDSYLALVYYLVDDECLTLVEIDYDWKKSFELGEEDSKKTINLQGNQKLQLLCTGIWNTPLSSEYDFFVSYLNKDIKERRSIGLDDNLEVTKINHIRYHNFNNDDGVKDFTSFIVFLYERLEKMIVEYEQDKKRAIENGEGEFSVEPSYFDRCRDIVSNYLDSTITRQIDLKR